MKRFCRFSSAFLSLMLIVLCLRVAQVQAVPLAWSIQALDTNTPDLLNYCPIEVDSNGYSHIAYTNKESGVMYATWNGSAWDIQKVVGGNVFDLKLDADNNPHILHDGGIYGLLCISSTGSNWTIQTVDKNGGGFGALDLDSFGKPHVAYTDGSLVKYASWTGAEWNIQVVDTSKFAPFRVDLAIDANNIPYIMYGSSEDVELAVGNGSRWNIQTVVSNMGSLGNLVLDSKGYPRFIYVSGAYPPNNTLSYVSWDGVGWHTQNVVSNVSGGGTGATVGIYKMASLSLDSHDYPYIAYVEAPGWGSLGYASWSGNSWDISTINSTIVVQSCYLAVDASGNPHISLVGVASGSDAEFLTGPYSWTATVMYATANVTKPVSPPTTPFSSTLADFAPLIVVAVMIVTIVSVLVYLKKRRPKI